jgi:NTP pyrophosphatase (non-canonical NTP hydrolase)
MKESFDFIHAWRVIEERVHQVAVDKGWWDHERNDGEMIALMHSELSEALEYLRHDNPPSDHIGAHSGAAEEMADCVIRIMDMGLARGWNVADAIIDKIRFNAEREYKHGGKKF